ncbi:MAG: alcohol dehydrogenase catalytic domain-containing protein [Nitrososphaerota archaeon]|nr:alcohol dehydrogenase catalytic domain-containing protein [Nitrososphaerota archaeon]
MMAVFVKKEGLGVEIRDVEIPIIHEGEILVKMRACGIDGTDLEKAYGKPITPPMLGHEVVGEVVESKSPEYEVGDKVFVHHHVFCGKCYYCLRNSYTMCPLFLKSTIDPCGLAEYFRVPKINVDRGAVLKLPSKVSWEEAAFIEPAACVLRALRRVKFRAGDTVSLLGVGPTGSLFIKLLKHFGAGLISVADLSDFRLNIAKKIGADIIVNPTHTDFVEICKRATDGVGVDIGILGTPTAKPIQLLLQTVRKGGRICVFGAPERGEKVELDFSMLFINEISIITSYSTSEVETNIILKFMREQKIFFNDLITHKFKLSHAEKAFETARDTQKSLKVIIEND